MKYAKPTESGIAELLEMIFGSGVKITASDDAVTAEQHVATFICPDDELVAVCGSDLPFAAYSGAALSMIPAAVANEAVGSGALTDMMKANFYEVMNICSKLMIEDGGAHLRLAKVLDPNESDAQIAQCTDEATPFGFSVDIPNYGQGKLAFLVT